MAELAAKPNIEQFCETMEKRSLEHGYDIIVRPRHALVFEWRLGCGHRVVLGISTLERTPQGLAWCNECNDYRIGFGCEEVPRG